MAAGIENPNGMPTNFFFFHDNGTVTPRAFGAFFDPLETGFFSAALFFSLYETHRRRLARFAGVLCVFVALLLLLTLTRAIIFGVAFVVIYSLLRKRGIASLPIWLALVAAGLFVVAAILNIESLAASLDPSSVGHLNAYLNISVTSALIGSPPDPGAPRGSESLYLTILIELGALVLVAYVVWFASIYRTLLRNYDFPYMRPALESMFIYILASFTTEHWFAITSGSLFWLLLGNTVGKMEKMPSPSIEQIPPL